MNCKFGEMPLKEEFYFQWHITEKCNLRCRHCYHQSYQSKGELTYEELCIAFARMENALESWQRMGSTSLTGGEPFLRRNALLGLAAMMDRSNWFKYYDILTNGSLITREDLDCLTGLEKLRRIQLSLESPHPINNDRIRGPGSFGTTISAIRRLKDRGFQVSVMMTITKSNQSDVPALTELLVQEGVDVLAIERFVPEGSGASMKDMVLSKEEVRQLYEEVYAIGVRERRIRILMHRPLFGLIDKDDSTVGAMCSIGVNALTIMHDGTIYPCRRLPLSIGNIIYDGVFKPWYDSDLLWSIRDASNLKGKCGACELVPICRGCRAMAYWINGDYLGEDPHCWR